MFVFSSMYVIYETFLFLVLLKCVIGDSHRSSFIEDGHPILRTGPDMDVEESIPEIQAPKPPDEPNPESWVNDLRSEIRNLVAQYGPADAEPYIRKLVDDTEKLYDVLLRVKVKRGGKTKIEYNNFRRDGNRFHVATSKPEPDWVEKLKLFAEHMMKEREDEPMDDVIQPVIKSIERKHKIVITKFDLDPRGEIVIEYANKETPVKWIDRKGPDSRRSKQPSKKESPLISGINSIVSLFSDTSFRAFKEPKEEPYWVSNFKEFVRRMLGKYSRHEINRRLKPQLKFMKDNYQMDIINMNVDDIGPIMYKVAARRGQLYRPGPRRSFNNTQPVASRKESNEKNENYRRGHYRPILRQQSNKKEEKEPEWVRGFKLYILHCYNNRIRDGEVEWVKLKLEKKYNVEISNIKVNFDLPGTPGAMGPDDPRHPVVSFNISKKGEIKPYQEKPLLDRERIKPTRTGKQELDSEDIDARDETEIVIIVI